MAEEIQLGFPIDGLEQKPLDPQEVREELETVLGQARAARTNSPWDRKTHGLYLASYTEKTRILPPEEAEFMRRQLVFEFNRIEQLLAA